MIQKSYGRVISVLSRYEGLIFDDIFSKYDISSGQYLYYLEVAGYEGINQKELSEALSVNKATTAKAIKKLEGKGLIVRKVDELDKRNFHLYLTEEGKKLLPMVREELKKFSELLVGGLDENTKDILFNSLKVMETNLLVRVNEIRKNKE